MNLNHIHKQIVIDFYKKIIGKTDIDLANKIIHDCYIQHSPTVKTGKIGFMEFLNFLKQLPQPKDNTEPFMRFICEGHFVAVHLSIVFMGEQRAVLDLYRLKNGLLVEHWDASETINNYNRQVYDAVKGPVVVEDLVHTEENKCIVKQYTQQILIDHTSKKWEHYIAEALIQHHPQIKNGREALIAYYKTLNIVSLHQIVGEGNFVVTQSKGFFNAIAYVIYDIYRLKARMIVEHWSVKQMIPETMAHSNGMI